jgi:DNA invertase Pin-like site-specific DNA recombinase
MTIEELAERFTSIGALADGAREGLTVNGVDIDAATVRVLGEWESARRSINTRTGHARAQDAGKHIGRPVVMDDAMKARAKTLKAGGMSMRAVAAELGVSKSVVDRALKD